MKRFHETKNYSFSGLVASFRKFIVPGFQRSYKWGNRQITDFFSSIETNDSGYFIGNIVCVLNSKKNEERLMIVDGQQRLTTITLMLIALRDYAKELMEDLKEDPDTVEWISEYLKDRDKRDRKDFYILKARKQSYNEVLIDLIDGATLDKKYDKAQSAYIKAYRNLKSLIKDKVGTDYSKLTEFTEKVLDLEVIAIVFNSDKEVFNAFDGLNSKGLGLSTSDQIKNYLYSHADKLKCLDEIEQKWTEIEDDFEKTNPELVTKFLRHLWIADNKYISGKDLYDQLKKDIDSKKTAKSLNLYLDYLCKNSKFYLGIKYKMFSHYLNDVDLSVREILFNFRYLENQQIYEILLALYQKSITDKKFKPKYFRDLTITLWNFCVRIKFLLISPSKYEREFAKYCETVRESNPIDVINKSKKFIEYLRILTKDREQFINTLNEDLTYESDSSLVEFLLKKIIEKNEKNVVTFTETSIEHIVPQEPKEWDLNKKDVKEYVHSIGNLTLLHPKDNQKASNKKMPIKCSDIYDKSHFKFNKNISTNYKDIFIDDFKEAIKQRGQDIAEQIFNLTKI